MMTRILFAAAFALGAAAVAWMALSFVGADPLALAVTVVIGGVYLMGFLELLQFRRTTATLSRALAQLRESGAEGLGDWLARLHPALRGPVGQRIEGDRVGLPAPVLTPYLVSLLVMLGLLGTFVGMVATLKGAVLALEGTTELQAIRAGLAAPIQGLSLAFGTSVAGVAASAMLGLASTLSRRDRLLAGRRLDQLAGEAFRGASLAHQRRDAYAALQQQSQALPGLVDRLQAMAGGLERLGEQLSEALLQGQRSFHDEARRAYVDLAASVDRSLQESLARSGKLAGEGIRPIVTEAMAEIGGAAMDTQRALASAAQDQLAGLSGRFEQTSSALLASVEGSLGVWLQRQEAGDSERRQVLIDSLGQLQARAVEQQADAAGALTAELAAVTRGQQAALRVATEEFAGLSAALTAQWEQSSQRLQGLAATLETELATRRQEEARLGEAAVDRLAALESTAASHLSQLGQTLEAPMARLIESASEAPRAAVELIGQLRRETSEGIERDNKSLAEREQLMAQLRDLAASLAQASAGQREAVEQLVSASASRLQTLTESFGGAVEAQVAKIDGVADHFAASAAEMASLGDAFGLAVELFSDANTQLIERLARMEEAMTQTSARSDDQMGYYVAQAREIIDQSMLSQRALFDELRQLGTGAALAAAEAG